MTVENEKYLRTKLKKIKKNWPNHLIPYLLPSGQLRIVKSHDEKALQLLGINSLEEFLKRPPIPNKGFSPKEKKIVDKLSSLLCEIQPLFPGGIPVFVEEYFPSIFERLSFPQQDE
jgi:hypothetical protein